MSIWDFEGKAEVTVIYRVRVKDSLGAEQNITARTVVMWEPDDGPFPEFMWKNMNQFMFDSDGLVSGRLDPETMRRWKAQKRPYGYEYLDSYVSQKQTKNIPEAE